VAATTTGCLADEPGKTADGPSSDGAGGPTSNRAGGPATWANHEGPASGARALSGERAAVDAPLEEAWTSSFESVPFDPATVSPMVATGETLVCFVRTAQVNGQRRYVVLDAASGTERWHVGGGGIEPPDGSDQYAEVRATPTAIAGGTVFVTAGFRGDGLSALPITGGVYALDAEDGTVSWSRRGYGTHVLGPPDRLYEIGSTDARMRADPDERTRDDGEWMPEPERDLRLHVRARERSTGELRWERTHPLEDGERTGIGGPLVDADRVIVSFNRTDQDDDTDEYPLARSDVLAFDGSGERDPTEISLDVPLLGSQLLVGERLVSYTDRRPEDDDRTDRRYVFAVDLQTGSIEWMTPIGTRMNSRLAGRGPVVAGGDRWYGIDPETGETEWTGDAVSDAVRTVCAVGDDHYAVERGASELQWRSLETGELRGRATLPGSADLTRVIASDGRFFVGHGGASGASLVALE